MSGRSTTGQWIVQSGGHLFGPFDGKTPARQFASKLWLDGYDAALVQLHGPGAALRAVEIRKHGPTPKYVITDEATRMCAVRPDWENA